MSTSPKNTGFASFDSFTCLFRWSLFTFFTQKNMKKHTSTSVCHAWHPKGGWKYKALRLFSDRRFPNQRFSDRTYPDFNNFLNLSIDIYTNSEQGLKAIPTITATFSVELIFREMANHLDNRLVQYQGTLCLYELVGEGVYLYVGRGTCISLSYGRY